METDGAVYGPIALPEIAPIPEPEIKEQPDSASASADRADGFWEKQKENGAAGPAVPAGEGRQDQGLGPTPNIAWAALPGEVVVLGMMEEVWLPALGKLPALPPREASPRLRAAGRG